MRDDARAVCLFVCLFVCTSQVRIEGVVIESFPEIYLFEKGVEGAPKRIRGHTKEELEQVLGL